MLAASVIWLAPRTNGFDGIGAIFMIGVSAQAAAPGGAPPPVVALTLSNYALPSNPNTTIGIVTTTFANGQTSTSSPISIAAGGTSSDGSICPNTGDFSLAGSNSLGTSDTYTSQHWEYVCLTASPPGRKPMTQLVFLTQTQPQHTSLVAIGDGTTTNSVSYPAYWQLLGPAYGWSLSARGPAASSATACGIGVGTVISDATGVIQSDYRQNPAWLLMVGGQDAKNQGNSGYAAYEQTFIDCLNADVSWLLIPDASKTKAKAATVLSGTWTDFTTTGLSAGTAMQASASGAKLRFSVPTVASWLGGSNSQATASMFIWWSAVSATNDNSGTSLSYQINSSGPSGTVNADNYGTTNGVQLTEIKQLTNGSNNVDLTVNAIGAHTSKVVIYAVGSQPIFYAGKLQLAGILAEQGGGDATAVAAYNTDIANIERVTRADQLDVNYVPVQNFVDPAADMTSALIPNATGQIHLANAFAYTLPKCISGVPAPADNRVSGYGLTCPIFDEEGTSLATVDVNNTFGISGHSGITPYNWYVQDNYPDNGQTQSWAQGTPSPIPANQFCLAASGCGADPLASAGINGIGVTPNFTHSPDPATPPLLSSCGATNGFTTTPPFLVGTQFAGSWYYEDQEFGPLTTQTGNGSFTGTISGGTLNVSSVPAASSFTGFIDDGSGHGSPSGIAGQVLTITGSTSQPTGMAGGQLLQGSGVTADTQVASAYNDCEWLSIGYTCPVAGSGYNIVLVTKSQLVNPAEAMTTTNTIGPGDRLSCSGCATNTYISGSQLSGTHGNTGTYPVLPGGQSVGSPTTITDTTQYYLTAWVVGAEQLSIPSQSYQYIITELDNCDVGFNAQSTVQWLVNPSGTNAGAGSYYKIPRGCYSGHIYGTLIASSTDAGAATPSVFYYDNGFQSQANLNINGLYQVATQHPCILVSGQQGVKPVVQKVRAWTRPL